MSWTEEKVAKLKELWGKGNTASQIAEIIGGISRNAVIGKAHRLNLSAKIKTRTAISSQKFENSYDEKAKKSKRFRKILVLDIKKRKVPTKSILYLCIYFFVCANFQIIFSDVSFVFTEKTKKHQNRLILCKTVTY